MVSDPEPRPRICVFAGPNATVLNSEPLVTSNKARQRHGLPSRVDDTGRPLRFDVLRPQRLAAPVTVYVEQFSAHPLERDAAELYASPDGYVDAAGRFHRQPTSADDVPVYEVTLEPSDGLYPLPYMARQADGRAWEGDEADPSGPPDRLRQSFYPDASRVFQEIDRLHPGDDGLGASLARLADYDFLRAAPSAGYTRGLAAAARTDVGEGNIPTEERGRDYFPYRPAHLIRQPTRRTLARLTNVVQRALESGAYSGGLWLEGSPYVEETAWWLNLLIDTTLPLAACAGQRPHGAIGNDGDRNIVDAVRYLTSRVWDDGSGRDSLGVVVVMDQRLMTARTALKTDARPGGYAVSGGHGGVVGSITSVGRPVVSVRPLQRHTWSSELRLSLMPDEVTGVTRGPEGIELRRVRLRDAEGGLAGDGVPLVSFVKHGQYVEDDEVDVSREVDILARIERNLELHPLSGIVAEGSAPFGTLNESAELALRAAVFSGMPVVKVGRGLDGITESRYTPLAIAGGSLAAHKARLLLMAALLHLGALPPAADPYDPTGEEIARTRAALDRYQNIFDRH